MEQGPHGDWPVIKRSLRQAWRHRWIIVLTLAFNAAAAALFARLFASADRIIRAIGTASNAGVLPPEVKAKVIADFEHVAIEMVVLAVPAALAAYGAWWFGQLVANRTMQAVRNEVLAHLVDLDLRFHQELTRGDLLTRLTNDLLNTLRLQQLLYGKVVQKPVLCLGLAASLFWIDWRLAGAITLILLPAGAVIWPLLRRTRERSHRARMSMERNFGVLEQITAGIKVIKAMGSADREVARYAESNADLVRANMRLARTRAQSDAVTAFTVFALTGAGMWACGWLFSRGMIDPAKLVSFLGILAFLVSNLRESQRAYSDMQEQIPSVERIFQLLDRRSALADPPAAPECPAPRQAIRFEQVRFRYAEGAAEVLRGIDLEIPVGKTVALVGSSGGGKSTLVDLIPRFHDVTGGRITWDGADIRGFRLRSIAQHTAIVAQEAFLFDDTVLANIAYGRPLATRAEIEAAARRANLHDDVLRLEGGLGYETRVGDRGGRLSGGQRQRVAIARALLRDAPILLLDEPTSALDAHSEGHVQAALSELMRGRTVVVIAHRLATVQHADRIYVLAGKDDLQPGTIIEQGTHAELVAKGGRYAELVRLQQLK